MAIAIDDKGHPF